MTRRIEVLRSTRLLDSAPEPAFDRLTRLAGTLIGAPVALISLVDETRQFFKSSWGLGEPWASRRETPLSYSFCDHVVHGPAPLIVADAREHPVLNARLAVAELGVIAYAGVPLIVDGAAIRGRGPRPTSGCCATSPTRWCPRSSCGSRCARPTSGAR